MSYWCVTKKKASAYYPNFFALADRPGVFHDYKKERYKKTLSFSFSPPAFPGKQYAVGS